MELRRAQPRALQPVPRRVLRRPAAADRGRPGAGAAAQADHLRRARLGPRRLDPGADHQPAGRPAGRLRADLPLHLPRPVGDPARERPDRGDVPGQDRRAGAGRPAVRPHPAPLHAGAAVGAARTPTRTWPTAVSGSCSSATCPRPTNPPSGCRFHTRCPKAREDCAAIDPPLVPVLGDGPVHLTACLHPLAVGEDLSLASPRSATPRSTPGRTGPRRLSPHERHRRRRGRDEPPGPGAGPRTPRPRPAATQGHRGPQPRGSWPGSGCGATGWPWCRWWSSCLIVLMAIFAPLVAAGHRPPGERAVPHHRADPGRPAPWPVERVLARHRRPRPRHPGPDRLRRAHLAARRGRRRRR